MSFEVDMAHCATEEDRRQREAEVLDREQGRLQSMALIEALRGDFDKLLSSVDYGDHDQRLMRVLMWAHAAGNKDASALVRDLAMTYAINHAEIT